MAATAQFVALLAALFPVMGGAVYQLSAEGSDAADLQAVFEVLPDNNRSGWLGADSDVSMVIGGGKTGRRALWIFADTFITRYDSAVQGRSWDDMVMPSSSVALVDCTPDACTGRPEFYWREDPDGKPTPFFDVSPERRADDQLLWVVSGIAARDGGSALLLAQRIQRPLTVLGSTALVVTGLDSSEDPRDWTYSQLDIGDYEMTWFSGITFAHDDGDEVLLFGHAHYGGPKNFAARGPANPERWSPTLLARASLSRLLQHDWSGTEYWTQPGRWAPAWPPHERREAKALNLPSWETTCTWSEELQLWYAFNVERPGIAMWTAEQVIGPWKRVGEVYKMPEPFASSSSWLCYAAKAHPEMQPRRPATARKRSLSTAASAELVFSWICNSWGTEETEKAELFQPGGMIASRRGYWPRFVRVRASARRDAKEPSRQIRVRTHGGLLGRLARWPPVYAPAPSAAAALAGPAARAARAQLLLKG